MSSEQEDIEIIRGSGNVFRDFGHADADAEHLKAVLAAKIIGLLDDRAMSTRKATEITGIAAADFPRVRQAKLDRFTVNQLMTILGRFKQEVDVTVSAFPREAERSVKGIS